MAWSESGLYVATVRDMLKDTIAGDWTLATSEPRCMTTRTPRISRSIPGTWTNANEVSGTGWAAGGVLVSAAATGPGSLTPTLTQSPTKSVMADATNDLSVATTTLTNAYGARSGIWML